MKQLLLLAALLLPTLAQAEPDYACAVPRSRYELVAILLAVLSALLMLGAAVYYVLRRLMNLR